MQASKASFHFSDDKDRLLVKRAAAILETTFSQLVAAAAVEKAKAVIVAHGRRCPTCGRAHSKVKSGDSKRTASKAAA